MANVSEKTEWAALAPTGDHINCNGYADPDQRWSATQKVAVQWAVAAQKKAREIGITDYDVTIIRRRITTVIHDHEIEEDW